MKITDVRLKRLESIIERPEALFEESSVASPTDIYPQFRPPMRNRIGVVPVPLEDGRCRISHTFVQVDTDEDVSGVAGPITDSASPFYIDTQIRPLLMGQDPLATEYLWDVMYRTAVDGRKGKNMHAIGYVDIALWDIKGKWLGQPLYRLLGGPVQQRIPAYANMAGFSAEPEKVRERIREIKEAGYKATKWYAPYGPPGGSQGIRKGVELVETVRTASGPDMKIMIDAWNSWNIPYALDMAERIKAYDVSWIEEPVMPDLIESYSRLTTLSPVPIAGGEHEYTRWGFKALMDRGAMHIYQPDPAWSGGISEAIKICSLASAYDVQVALHASLTSVAVHVSCACSPSLVSVVEYLLIISEASQFFLKHPVRPVKGFFTPPDIPGAGMDLDKGKIESERTIAFTR